MNNPNQSLAQKRKERESQKKSVQNREVEHTVGFGNKKLEGPNRPST
ncbi:hypothetical protein [Hazenella coriacea]|uniref:Uncharacterized protein n=1 Tax=Hazenella coriacea TaxID=1179467 RepID=A0A4R3L9F7_9BACL|nr:hypothetical protein [Hazenella coriacea]TCS96701.1 hypothetical protein EDD58_101338 [Hazenella coriacea]